MSDRINDLGAQLKAIVEVDPTKTNRGMADEQWSHSPFGYSWENKVGLA